MVLEIVSPDEVSPLSVREAGGDNEVPRDAKGRPRIVVPCFKCSFTGRVPSEKRPGNTVQCPRCKGEGERVESYTRCTTYIDVLDDKTNLQAWGERMVLLGCATDPSFLEGVLDLDTELKQDKDTLTKRAKSAKAVAGAEDKADKGTHLHALSELVDQGKPLPSAISFGDVIDMDAYKRATEGFEIVHMEKLVVHDGLRIAGTPDRKSRWKGDLPLIAPDGAKIGPDELLITDLKTGSVEYGALKMAMQLSVYAHSKLYDWRTGKREPLENINQRWGVIMHLPAGRGECTLYWANLTLGWNAVALAGQVRDIRRTGKNALVPVEQTLPSAGASA